MIGDFLGFADGVGGDGDAAAGVGLDDVDGVVALEEGETVPGATGELVSFILFLTLVIRTDIGVGSEQLFQMEIN